MNTRNSEGVKSRASALAVRLATRFGYSPLFFYGISLISVASFIVSLTHGPRLFPLINYRCRSIMRPILNRLSRSSPRRCFTDFRKRTLWIPPRDRRWLDNYGRTTFGYASTLIRGKIVHARCTHGDLQGTVNKAGARFPTLQAMWASTHEKSRRKLTIWLDKWELDRNDGWIGILFTFSFFLEDIGFHRKCRINMHVALSGQIEFWEFD